MAYAVIGYPELWKEDFQFIQDYRKEHDEWLYPAIPLHFTFVFPVFDIPEAEFTEEAVRLGCNTGKIDFTLRCAVINKDSFSDYYHALLVPDEGFSQIVKLHDKLYSGLFKSNHRLDIDFIPHAGIGNSKDKTACKAMVDELNRLNFVIRGSITRLHVIRYENGQVENLKEIIL